MKRILSIAVITLLTMSLSANETEDPFAEAEEKVYRTSQGTQLYAWLTHSDGHRQAPLVVLLHMREKDHESYGPFLTAMRNHVESDTTQTLVMPYTLSFDMRGHGKSTRYGRAWLAAEDMRKPHWMDVPAELAEMTDTIIADSSYNIDPERIYLVGASIGAQAAMLMTGHMKQTARVAMLSPTRNYFGLEIPETLYSYDGRMLIIIDKRDHRRFQQCTEMFQEHGRDNLELMTYSERLRGTDLIDGQPRAMADLIEWLFKD
ncbi:MAG: hypothetical protein JSU65_08095 [Candidatus Zixiibacteriota bacterium]|nr:MAG: hypothetical protein JSU65_08095 [candidate division Zixibacteria bacterium]